MNENMLIIIKSLSIRGAYLRTIRQSICEASSLMLQDKIRDRLNEMYNDVSEMIEQNDESIKFWSTEDEKE